MEFIETMNFSLFNDEPTEIPMIHGIPQEFWHFRTHRWYDMCIIRETLKKTFTLEKLL